MSNTWPDPGSTSISRRELMARGLALGCGLFASPLLASCGEDEPESWELALLACPVFVIAPAGPPTDLLPAWGNPVTVTTPGTGFGLTQGSADILCGNPHAPIPCTITSWTASRIEVTLPPEPGTDCIGPFRLQITIPQAVGAALKCAQPIPLVRIPGVEIPPPPIPVLAILFEQPMVSGDFSKEQIETFPLNHLSMIGRALVATDKQGPLPAVSDVVSLGNVINPLLTAAVLAAFPLLGAAVPLVLTALTVSEKATSRTLCYAKAGTHPFCDPTGELDDLGLTDFFDIEYSFFPRISAEDIMSSFVVIGPPGTRVRMFNSPDYHDGAGSFEVTIDERLVAICPRLIQTGTPYDLPTIPPGRVTVLCEPPVISYPFTYQLSFDNALSSLRFEEPAP